MAHRRLNPSSTFPVYTGRRSPSVRRAGPRRLPPRNLPMTPVRFALAALAVASLPTVATANDAPLSPAQRSAVEAVVRDYIRDHPEIIVEALEAMRERQRVAEEEAAQRALTLQKAEIFESSG